MLPHRATYIRFNEGGKTDTENHTKCIIIPGDIKTLYLQMYVKYNTTYTFIIMIQLANVLQVCTTAK